MDRLETEMQGTLDVVRLDITSPAGRTLGQRWRAPFTPAFILFDGQGREIWRGTGSLDPAAIQTALTAH